MMPVPSHLGTTILVHASFHAASLLFWQHSCRNHVSNAKLRSRGNPNSGVTRLLGTLRCAFRQLANN